MMYFYKYFLNIEIIYQFFNYNTLFLTTKTPSYCVLLNFESIGGLYILILLFKTNKGFSYLKTSSFNDIPSRYC